MLFGRLADLLIFCGLSVAPVLAQGSAQLYGRILDTSEGGIGGALVSAVNEDTGFRRTALSDPAGAYAIASLDPGSYKIIVRKEGFRSAIRFNVRLETGAPGRVDFTLPVGSVNESIVVSGAAPPIDRDDAATGAQFDHEQVERLPVNGGGLLSLLEMVPGASLTPATRGEPGQFTVNGQRPNSNYFTVDGVSANNGIAAGGLPVQAGGGALPSLSAFGSLDSMISLEAVGEMRVQTSSTFADSGRLPGAAIAITSQSGANDLHGSTLFRLRNQAVNANDWFANQAGFARPPLRLYDLTQTFGAPLKRNRTFVFLSYQHISLNQPFLWQQPVPAPVAGQPIAAWAQPLLQLFPPANGAVFTGGIGVWSGLSNQPAALDAGGIRLDQALTSRVSLFARYNDSPSTNNFGSLDVNRLDLRAQSLTAGLNARATPALTLDFRINQSQTVAHSLWLQNGSRNASSCPLQPLIPVFGSNTANCNDLIRFTIAGAGTLENGNEGDWTQRQFQVVQSAAWQRGRHSFSFGADFRSVDAIRRVPGGALSVVADQMSDLADARYPWYAVSPPLTQTAAIPELSLWAGDTWQLSPRLTLSLGLRWEYSPSPLTSGPSWFFDPAVNGFQLFQQPRPVWATSRRDFAPRFGLAYRVTPGGRTVLRAGGGLYYDSSLSIATDILNGGPMSIGQYGSQRNGVFSTVLSYGFAPGLSLPEVRQWNVSIEHGFTARDLVSLGYVGSAGQGLIRRELGGPGTTTTALIALTTNYGFSRYQALQAQYRRQLARGLEFDAGYTWAHSIDNVSSDSFLVWAGAANDRGSSDFDLRHMLSASASWELPHPAGPRALGRALGGWALSGVFHTRTGFPITVQESEEYMGISLINAFRPTYMLGQPIWVADPNSPGGRRLNPIAFIQLPPGVQGNLGRNAIQGFGMEQLDLALTREFRIADRSWIQVRAAAFNALNQANFADPVKYLDSPLFGQSASMLNMMLGTGSPGSGLSPILQTGGPRSFQLSLRLRF